MATVTSASTHRSEDTPSPSRTLRYSIREPYLQRMTWVSGVIHSRACHNGSGVVPGAKLKVKTYLVARQMMKTKVRTSDAGRIEAAEHLHPSQCIL